MIDFDKDFNEVMDLLKTVPGVKEHLQSFEVQMGKQILQRRLELGWTQQELVQLCREMGVNITQPMLSNIENGSKNVESHSYNGVLDVLGGVKGLNIEFGDAPSRPNDEKKRVVNKRRALQTTR